ncbi:MAG: M20 family peptidase [Solirubrobacterales bacterium]
MKKFIFLILICVGLLVLIIATRSVMFASKQENAEPAGNFFINTDQLAYNMSEAIKFKTISYDQKNKFNGNEFTAYNKFLETTYPNAHKVLQKEVINNYSLLYTWKGSDENLKPILLISHTDVVPAESKWEQEPFSGIIKDGFVWGRGALDNKSATISAFEAIESLAKEGFSPNRTIYFAIGHDEELVGPEGAGKTAELLKSRGIRFDYILDEGGIISENILPVSSPVALVGIAEKGYISLELSVEGEEGHASIPPKNTSIGILSEAVCKIEKGKMPGGSNAVTDKMFEYLGPEMPLPNRIIFANIWLFNGLVEKQLEKSPSSNAIINNTAAVTMIQGGIKENILPNQAKAVINFRALPGYRTEDVLNYVKKTINNEKVKVKVIGHTSEPSKISSTDSEGFKTIEYSIRQTFPDTIVAPYLLTGGTDSAHYADLSENIYRFSPIIVDSETLKSIHSNNEKISIKNLEQSVKCYRQIIINSCIKN